MARRVAKRIMGVQDDGQITYRRDAISTSIREQAIIPTEVGLTSYRVENHDKIAKFMDR